MMVFIGVPALLGAIFAIGVCGHRPALPSKWVASCDSDFGSSKTAMVLSDASISWSFKHYLDCSNRAIWARWINPAENSTFYVGVGTPPMPRFAALRADALIIGPGLPALSAATKLLLPAEVLSDPVWNITGIGAIFHRSPQDQSTCGHLGAVMANSSTVKNGRCDFYEPHGATNSWRILDADGNQLPTSGAMYYAAVFLQSDTSGKVGIALGTWAENFVAASNLTSPSCKRSFPDWSEQKEHQGSCLPVLSCPLANPIPRITCTLSTCPRAVVANACEDTIASNMMCTMGKVCDCSAVIKTNACGTTITSAMGNTDVNAVCAKTCATCGGITAVSSNCEDTITSNMMCTMGKVCDCSSVIKTNACGTTITSAMGNTDVNAVCAKTCNATCSATTKETTTSQSMNMVCGGDKCPVAAKAWSAGMMPMHSKMAIKYTCDTELDFIRGMIPHHQGAVDMCDILTMDLACTASGDLDGLMTLCSHVRKEQTKEVAGMTAWLGSRAVEAKCAGGESGCGNLTCPSSKAFMAANAEMHRVMVVRLGCMHEVDFVRQMLPHHAGAIEMCNILSRTTQLSDPYLIELCFNITRAQRAELAWMSEWLVNRSQPLSATCQECAHGIPPSQPMAHCEDILPATSFCHQPGWNCTCEGAILEVPCDKGLQTAKYGYFNPMGMCRRTCGGCPAEREPLLHPPCNGTVDSLHVTTSVSASPSISNTTGVSDSSSVSRAPRNALGGFPLQLWLGIATLAMVVKHTSCSQ
ncbi:unnamed protein product [Polarella glacialis]|uniref:DUF305 domain-containing protein n=1 Tax=Polarella glacialis TaxID=89957 RepID=A0A813JQX3_POLGL|nr:unnamed protein product [Polarella glacialis]